MIRPLYVLLIGLPWLAYAAQTSPATGVAPLSAWRVVQAMASLGLVLLLIVALAWFMRRWLGKARVGGAFLKIRGGVMLGSRERLVVVEAGDRCLLLGVTSQQINLITELPLDSFPAEKPAATFQDWLQVAMTKAARTKPADATPPSDEPPHG